VSRAAAERRYRELRALAYRDAEEALAGAGIAAELRAVDAAALDAFAAGWTGHPTRRMAWPWPAMAEHWRRSFPERFELAVWWGGTLCALALGKPSAGTSHLGAHFMEGSPDPAHPLKGRVIAVTLAALDSYAVLLGKAELRLVEPLPALVPLYCGPLLGFELVRPRGQAPYCRRSIAP